VSNVFAYFDPADPHPLTRLWVKSWAARGWIPRLILPSEINTGLTLRQVANRRGGGLVTTPADINYARTPRTQHPRKSRFPDVSGDTVIFPEGTEDEVLHCGRPLQCQ
jgi:hypothetical protein